MTDQPNVVDRAAWLKQRVELLGAEKALTRDRERLAERRRQLPWVAVEADYVFDGADGPVPLAGLFAGRGQLLVYHFMFAPDWSQGCPSCSLLADHFDPAIVHLNRRDTTMVCASRAPVEKLRAFRRRMGWGFDWVSSGRTAFNRDFGVYFSDADLADGASVYNYTAKPYPISDLPGLSVFAKGADGAVYHTYSTYARGLDGFLNVYNLLDVTPKGRDEHGKGMSWVRHHDRYDAPDFVVPWKEAKAEAADAKAAAANAAAG